MSRLDNIDNGVVKIIIKRDGREEEYTPSKLDKVLLWATNNDSSQIEILKRDTEVTLKEKVKVKELYDSILNTAISNISPLQTKWEFTASKLYLLKMYSDSYGIKDKKYPHLKDVIKKGIESKVYSKSVMSSYTDTEIEELNSYIRPEEDYTFTYNALKQFNSKYCKKYSKTKKLELPQITYMRVAMGLCYNLEDKITKVKNIYDILTRGQATNATPIMMNSGTPLNQFSSCILNTIGNDTWDISNKLTTASLYTKGRGGLAFDVTHIQAKGSLTNNGVSASGIVPYIKNIEAVVNSFMQGDERRGSAVITCAWWHSDIEDFLELKDASSGTPETRALHLKYSFGTNDYFMNKVVKNEDVYLLCPKDAESLLYSYGDEFASNYEELIEKSHIRKKKINALDLYKKYLKYRFQTGNIYEIMLDNVNKSNILNRYVGSSNLCVTPETKILTKKGYLPIGDLEGTYQSIWNGVEWSDNVQIVKTGKSQEVLKITTTGGEVECTPYHKFYVQPTYSGKAVMKRANELVIGDKLIKYSLPLVEGKKILSFAYENGFFTGDGCQARRALIDLYGNKKELLPRFKNLELISCVESERDNRVRLRVQDGQLQAKYYVPSAEYTIKSRLDWFAGLLDSDGCLTSNNGSQSLQISSIDLDFLYEVRLMLQTLGVDSKVILGMPKRKGMMPKNDGTGDYGEYDCKQSWRLLIAEGGVQQLLSLGLDTSRVKPIRRTPNRDAKNFIKVVDILNEGRLSDTYCFTEPKRNMGMFNGMLLGNCQEVLIPSRPAKYLGETILQNSEGQEIMSTQFINEEIGLCNLSAFNLCIFDLPKDQYDNIVYNILLVLDNTMDIGNNMRVGGKYTNQNYRYVGLGGSNYAYYLANKGINFDSYEAEIETFKLFQKFHNSVIRASARLAKEKGTFPKFKETKWAEGILPYDLGNSEIKDEFSQYLDIEDLEETRDMVKQYGVRNALVINFPPTASSATSKNLTESIEPIMNYSYRIEGAVSCQVLAPDLARLRKFYNTAYNIDPKRLIKLGAIRQVFIDQSQSMNMYIDQDKWDYTYLAKLHLYAWKLGIKTLYYLFTPKSGVEDSCESCSS